MQKYCAVREVFLLQQEAATVPTESVDLYTDKASNVHTEESLRICLFNVIPNNWETGENKYLN